MATTWKNAFADGPCMVALMDNGDDIAWSGNMSSGDSRQVELNSADVTLSVSTDGVVSLSGEGDYSFSGNFRVRIAPTAPLPGAARARAMALGGGLFLESAQASDSGASVALTMNGGGTSVSPDPAQPTDDPAEYIELSGYGPG